MILLLLLLLLLLRWLLKWPESDYYLLILIDINELKLLKMILLLYYSMTIIINVRLLNDRPIMCVLLLKIMILLFRPRLTSNIVCENEMTIVLKILLWLLLMTIINISCVNEWDNEYWMKRNVCVWLMNLMCVKTTNRR